MLPKRHRLRHSVDIKRVRQSGRSLRHPLAVLLLRENDAGISRYAFAASGYIGNAVVRNRAKRLMREVVRVRLDCIRSGWDCLFLARRGIVRASSSEVEAAITWLLTRSDLLSVSACDQA